MSPREMRFEFGMLQILMRRLVGVGLLLCIALAAPAFAAGNALDAGMPAFPTLTGPVVDQAHLLPTAVFDSLSQKLAAYAGKNGTQLVVVTVPTLNGYPIEYYGYQLGRHWGIGQKGKNNGALLIVDVGEKRVRIEVGYGLEGTLTDAQSSNIINSIILPRFKKGDYAGGIVAGTDGILAVLGGQQGTAPKQTARAHSGTGFLMLLIIVFFVFPLFGSIFGRRRLAGRNSGSGWLAWLLLGMLGGGGGGGFGGGGGGGFGGFSGGGGSFGGGGASGGW